MTVSVVLVNHNGFETTLRAIQSVLDQGQNYEKIILVDNHSDDGSVEAVRENYPMVQVVELKENKGLPYARNIGLAYIHSKLVLFVDDDVLLKINCLPQMMRAMQETSAVMVCPRIILHPENLLQCDGAAVHFVGTLSLRHGYEEIEQHTPVQSIVSGFIGACMLFDTNILQSMNGFDEDYFFYFEDMELSYRLIALGYKICCEERAVVLHERGAGTENLSFRGQEEVYPLKRAYFNFRHRWLTLLIHYQIQTLLLLSPALLLYEIATLAESIRRGWLPTYLQAFFSILANHKSIWIKRKKWQRWRKISDKEILIGGKLPFSRGFAQPQQSKLINMFESFLNLYWSIIKKWL